MIGGGEGGKYRAHGVVITHKLGHPKDRVPSRGPVITDTSQGKARAKAYQRGVMFYKSWKSGVGGWAAKGMRGFVDAFVRRGVGCMILIVWRVGGEENPTGHPRV